LAISIYWYQQDYKKYVTEIKSALKQGTLKQRKGDIVRN